MSPERRRPGPCERIRPYDPGVLCRRRGRVAGPRPGFRTDGECDCNQRDRLQRIAGDAHGAPVELEGPRLPEHRVLRHPCGAPRQARHHGTPRGVRGEQRLHGSHCGEVRDRLVERGSGTGHAHDRQEVQRGGPLPVGDRGDPRTQGRAGPHRGPSGSDRGRHLRRRVQHHRRRRRRIQARGPDEGGSGSQPPIHPCRGPARRPGDANPVRIGEDTPGRHPGAPPQGGRSVEEGIQRPVSRRDAVPLDGPSQGREHVGEGQERLRGLRDAADVVGYRGLEGPRPRRIGRQSKLEGADCFLRAQAGSGPRGGPDAASRESPRTARRRVPMSPKAGAWHPQKRAFSSIKWNDREGKPRSRGLTEIRGPYYSVVGLRYLQDVLESAGDYIDSLKFAAGSFAVIPKKVLKQIIDLCHSYDVLVSTGGWIEYVLTQGPAAVERYIDEVKSTGFDILELSAGFISLPVDDWLALVERTKEAGLKTKPEGGIQWGAGR